MKEQAKIEQQYCVKQFATHKATLIQDTDRYFIADWRRADGSSDYYINFILDKKRGSIIISGDLGDCVATWYNALTPEKLWTYIRHNPEYFISKFQASSDKYFYDEEEILNDIKAHFKDYELEIQPTLSYKDEEEFWTQISDEIYNSYCNKETFVPSENLRDLISDYDPDYYEWLYSCGESIAKRVYLWIYAFEETLKQLGYLGTAEVCHE